MNVYLDFAIYVSIAVILVYPVGMVYQLFLARILRKFIVKKYNLDCLKCGNQSCCLYCVKKGVNL